jgi:tripartite-type tricarboxylate transporter receptor subunit TctC
MMSKRYFCRISKITAIFLFVLGLVFMLPLTEIHAKPYYEGKTVRLIVSWDPGGRIDTQARTVAKFLGKYIPGKPHFIIQNIPGASGIPANKRFNRSKPDGKTMMMLTSRDLEPAAYGLPGVTYDPLKYVWFASVSLGKQRNTLFTHNQSGFKSLDDLKTREVALGGQRVGHRSYLYGRLAEEIFGLKVRWVLGYATMELDVAIERGEVDGRFNDAASTYARRPDWIERGLITPHVAMTLPEKLPPITHPLYANVPSLMQFAKTEIQRNMIRKINTTETLSGSMALPPGTPDKIRGILEKAALAAGKDPEFQQHWVRYVLRGGAWGGVFSTQEVKKAVGIYMEWKPGVREAYQRLGYQAP